MGEGVEGVRMKYEIEVVFIFEVEAQDQQHAEDIGWDWKPKHPQEPGMAIYKTVSPDIVEVKA